jgi:hypothetical protein
MADFHRGFAQAVVHGMKSTIKDCRLPLARSLRESLANVFAGLKI